MSLVSSLGRFTTEKHAAELFVEALVPEFSVWCLVSLFREGELKPLAFLTSRDSTGWGDEDLPKSFSNLGRHYRSHSCGCFHALEESSKGESADSEIGEGQSFFDFSGGQYLICPLEDQGEAIGAVYFGFSGSSKREQQQELLLFSDAICKLLSLSLARDRLYVRSRNELKAREETLAIVAHDIVGPISTMMLASDMIERSLESGSEGRSFIAKYSRLSRIAGDRGLRLVQDLLDFTKLENGNFKLDRGHFRARELMSAVANQFQLQLEGKKLSLDLDFEKGSDEVEWDRDRLLQAFGNILGNAVKFTPEGGRVGLKTVVLGDSVEISFCDSGPGMDSASLDKVFRKFWQAGEVNSLGSGLGLFIAKGIIEAHGGSIWAESPPEGGGLFRCVLPRNGKAGPEECAFHP